jgi:DNA-binding beta-propeller fold protein YncE
VRFVGEGVLDKPQYVDCNADVVVVSESEIVNYIHVFSWADGGVRAWFGSYGSGPGQLKWPRGVRLLADGSGVVVADSCNHRLCVFTLCGKFLAAVGRRAQGLDEPCDVLKCATDGSFIIANSNKDNLIKLSRDGVKVGVYSKKGGGNGEFYRPTALAALPGGAMLVRDRDGSRCSIIRDHCHRLQWMGVCVSAALPVTRKTTC